MISPSALPMLAAAFVSAWIGGFILVWVLGRSPALRQRLRDVPGLMVWQIGVVSGVFGFAVAPAGLQWALFALAAARMAYEALRIHAGQWSAARAGAVILSPILPLALLALVLREGDAAATLILAFLLSEVFDSFAYVGGKVFGRRKVAPWLSPHKTWEGLLTGAAVCLALALTLSGISVLSLPQALICSAAAAVFATLGDLSASLGKRLAGVKDYPMLIASQGGLLDMFDSWIYVAPMTAFALALAA